MTDPTMPPEGTAQRRWSEGLLAPTPSAVAALVLAAVSLMGQNLPLIGVQAVLGQGFQRMSIPDQGTYYLIWGISALVPIGVAALLAVKSLRGSDAGWPAHLARAALLLAAVAAAGAVLTTVGGLIHTPF
jgi:hypothetical protein